MATRYLTNIVVILAGAMASLVLPAAPAGAEVVFTEDFELPNVTGGYNQGTAPVGWVKAAQGYRSNYEGLIDKDLGDFTAPAGNDQAYAFRYTNSGLTTAAGVIGVVQAYATYTVSFDVVMDVGSALPYSVQLIAFAEGVPRDDCRSTPVGSKVLKAGSGNANNDGTWKTVSLDFTADAEIYAAYMGFDIGVRLIGATTSAIIDNVQVAEDAAAVPVLTLRADTATGATTLLGHSSHGVAISYYEITSAGESLDSANWSSLTDQDFEGSGPPNGTGNGWEEAGGAGSGALAEAFLLGNSTIGAAQSISLGMGYDAGVGAEDLVFTYLTASGEIKEGLVEYVTSASPGDANLDGVVDAADFMALKKNFGQASGAVFQDGDFDRDRAVGRDDLMILMGSFAQGAASAATVPEPATLSLLCVLALSLPKRGSLALIRWRDRAGSATTQSQLRA